MATFLELQDASLHDDFDATKYRTWAKRFINEAIGLIYRTTTLSRGDITTSASISSGDAIEDLAQEGVVIQGVYRQDTGEQIHFLPRDEFEQLKNELGSSSKGPPVYYTIEGTGTATTNTTRIEFLPIADKTYTLDVVARFAPTQMSGDSDVVPLPPDYAYFPVRFARSKLFALEDDEEMSVFWNNEWLGALSAIKSDLQRRRIGPRQTPSMWANVDTGPRFHHPQGLF